jgi:hypothetical protein
MASSLPLSSPWRSLSLLNSGDPGATLARASLNSGDPTAAERNNAAHSRPFPLV